MDALQRDMTPPSRLEIDACESMDFLDASNLESEFAEWKERNTEVEIELQCMDEERDADFEQTKDGEDADFEQTNDREDVDFEQTKDREDTKVINLEERCERGNARQLRKKNESPWVCDNLALPVHYMWVGVSHSIMTGTLYGVMMGSMAVSGRIYGSSKILVSSPWLLTVVFGFISDCIPIMGYHRKYYASIGWTIVAGAHMVLAVSFEDPKIPRYCRDTLHGDLGNFVQEAGICNPDADESAWFLVYVCAVGTIGLALAESAADGLLVECAQSYNEKSKSGVVMIQSLAIRLFGGALGSSFTAICFNGRKHLGFFDWEIDFNFINYFLFGSALCVAVLWQKLACRDMPTLASTYCKCSSGGVSYETIQKENPRLYNFAKTHCASVAIAVDKISSQVYTPRFTRFAIFQMVVPIFTWMTSPANDMMRRYWNDVQQMQEQVTGICVTLFFSIILIFMKDHSIWNDRRIVTVITTCIAAAGGIAITTTSASGVLRDQYFYQIHEIFLKIPRGFNYVIAMILTAEFSPKGLEASIYGIISCLHNLAPVIAQTLANPLYAYLPPIVTNGQLPIGALSLPELYMQDTLQFRHTVTTSLFVSASLLLSSLFMLKLLPPEGIVLRIRKSTDETFYNKMRCSAITLSVACLAISSLLATIFAITPETSCHALVGGPGC